MESGDDTRALPADQDHVEPLISHYRIIKQLGAGGMGKVYLAQDTQLGRSVALKLPGDLSADPIRLRRFMQEARLASSLNHPNVCIIHEVGNTDSGEPFIAMEYIEGETLSKKINHTPIELSVLLAIAVQIVDALDVAHSKGIVHRDIKSDNIILTPRHQAKVLDFGLAKLNPLTTSLEPVEGIATSPKTVPGTVMGTLHYMSPEQAMGREVDARSDVFSFGIVLYEMATGILPFKGASFAEITQHILNDQPDPIARYNYSTPAELERIIRKCLEKDRERRYQTAKELLVDLQNLKRDSEKGGAENAKQSLTNQDNALVVQPRSRYRLPLTAGALLLLTLLLSGGVYQAFFRKPGGVSPSEIKSLAILPLKLINQSKDDEYLGLGICDTLITKVSQIRELTVSSTSTVRKYSNHEMNALDAARELSVDGVLEGTVQRAGDRLRVNVNLLRVADGASLWSDSLDFKASDLLEVEDQVSRQVAEQLRLKLSETEKARLEKRYTANQEAYEYYLKGRIHFERVSTSNGDMEPGELAIAAFKKAIEIDPKYALAHAALARTYMWVANFNDPNNPVWVGLAKESVKQAESLDPHLAETHVVWFEYYFSTYGDWDLARAAKEARQATALNPSVGHIGLGTMYDHIGLDEAAGLREIKRAVEIEQTNEYNQYRLIESYLLYGKWDDALEADDRFFGKTTRAKGLIGKHRLEDAQTLVEKNIERAPGDFRSRAELALVLALKGKFKEAEAGIPGILSEAQKNRAYHHIMYDLASVYALEGKTSEAVKLLQRTADTGMPNYTLFNRDKNLDRIRNDASFVQFMSELKKKWDGYRRDFE